MANEPKLKLDAKVEGKSEIVFFEDDLTALAHAVAPYMEDDQGMEALHGAIQAAEARMNQQLQAHLRGYVTQATLNKQVRQQVRAALRGMSEGDVGDPPARR